MLAFAALRAKYADWPRARAEERFLRKVERVPLAGCWLWTGAVSVSEAGDVRPNMVIHGHRERAYRIAYELFIGPIPPGMLVCHSCDVSICVNPAHLFLGTHQDNQHDSARKGRAFDIGKWRKDNAKVL